MYMDNCPWFYGNGDSQRDDGYDPVSDKSADLLSMQREGDAPDGKEPSGLFVHPSEHWQPAMSDAITAFPPANMLWNRKVDAHYDPHSVALISTMTRNLGIPGTL